MSKLYLRIQPYDARRGCLCQRYTVAGRTYVAGQWYGVSTKLADLLAEEKQGSGAPVFEILNEAEWRQKARAEIYAQMMVQGSVLPGAQPAPPVAHAPKTGPVKGKYDDFRDTEVEEVDAHAAVTADMRKNVAEVAADPEPEEAQEVDFDGMTKAEMIATAEEYGVDLDDLGSRPTKDEIRAKLESELYE